MNTVVAAIIARTNANGEHEYLLVSSKKDFGVYTGYYYPPAGHVEDGEDEVAALKREVSEELGMTITSVQKIAETPGDVPDQRTIWYACDVASYEFHADPKEIANARFVTREQMKTMNIWPATKQFFEKYIA